VETIPTGVAKGVPKYPQRIAKAFTVTCYKHLFSRKIADSKISLPE
jgi:hypothetical protein